MAAIEQSPTELSAAGRELQLFLESALPEFEKRWGKDRGFEAQLAWQRVLNESRWVAASRPVVSTAVAGSTRHRTCFATT